MKQSRNVAVGLTGTGVLAVLVLGPWGVAFGGEAEAAPKPATLLEGLKSPDAIHRYISAGLLERYPNRKAVKPLLAILRNPEEDGQVRIAAAGALAKIDKARTIKAISDLIKDATEGRADWACIVLQSMGPEGVEPLIAFVSAPGRDKFSLFLPLPLLGDTHDPRALEPLVALLESPDRDENVRTTAVSALGKLGDKRAFEPLLRAAQSKDKSLQVEAIVALGKLRDERAYKPLVAIAQDKTQPDMVRGSAMEALGKLGDKAAYPLLLQMLKDKSLSGSTRGHAADGLGHLGDERAFEPLQALVQDEKQERVLRAYATTAMMRLKDPRVTKTLVSLLGTGEFTMLRYSIVGDWGRLHDKRAIPHLKAIVTAKKPLAIAAVCALHQIGAKEAFDLAMAMFTDKHSDGYQSASLADVFGKLKDKRAVEPLMAVVRDTKADLDDRRWATMALGELGDPRAAPALRQALRESKDERFRWNIASALIDLGVGP